MSNFRRFLPAIILYLIISSPCSAVIFVDANAPGPIYNGASWSRAFKTISAAISSMQGGNSEIWVRAGVYNERLSISANLSMYGGFVGYETTLSQRIVNAFPSIIDAENKGIAVNITSATTDIIDGFTIRRGQGTRGAGICTVANTIAKIYNCRIENCKATDVAGGVYYASYAQGEMNDCVLTHNKAKNGGGAVIEYHSYPTLRRNVFSHNEATVSGGGLYCPFHSGAYLENCNLVYNTAAVSGGGLYAYYGGPVTLNYCIIAFNSAPAGGGLYGGGPSSQAVYSFCDLHSNAGGNIGGAILVQQAYQKNFSADPLFLMPENDEFHVIPGSPCATAGVYPLASSFKMEKIGYAKLLPVGTAVELTGKIVSCLDGQNVYIQEPDRSAAISVQGLSGYSRWSIISSIKGILTASADGKKYLQVSANTISTAPPYPIRPLGVRPLMLNKLTGICTRTWGRVEAIAPDGFALRDDSMIMPVIYNGGNAHTGDFISTTGVYTNAGCFVASDVQVVSGR